MALMRIGGPNLKMCLDTKTSGLPSATNTNRKQLDARPLHAVVLGCSHSVNIKVSTDHEVPRIAGEHVIEQFFG